MSVGRAVAKGKRSVAAGTSGSDPLQSLFLRARRAALRGDVGAAIPLYVEVISKGCMLPAVFNDLGTLLAQTGQIPAAVIQFEVALGLDPSGADARGNLRRALDAMGHAAFKEARWADAAAAYTRLVAIDGDSAVSQTNAGMALRQMRSFGHALSYLRRAVELNPQSAPAHFNLGSVLFELNDTECESEFRRAVELDPRHVDARVNLAVVHNRTGRLESAAALVRQALSIAPDHAEAHANMAGILREQGEVGASLEHYRRAAALRPNSHRTFSNYLLARQADPTASPADLLADHVAWSARFASAVDPGTSGGFSPTIDRDPDRRLRIGYVSADLRSHSVASFIEPILAAHDHDRVHVTCYSDGVPDRVTERIQATARPDVWRDVRPLSDDALAKRIVDDGIDVLVDLSGHTADNRLLAFARRPAPVQVTYCGYPSTTGLASMGWRLTDDVADPVNLTDRWHAERLWRLPNGFLCFAPDPDCVVPGPSPFGSRGFVTFGSFNNLSKVGDGVLELWAEIVRSVPGSHLFLKSRALSDDEPRERLRGKMLRLGVESDRLEFAPYAATPREHVALYDRVDVGLDPFPYTGTTTTCEALWMGVPVITLPGIAHASRVGASLLTRIGCPELVADSPSAYFDIATGLARNTDRLVAYRADLRGRMKASPLTNPAVITRDIEAAYREMWRCWCSDSQAPQSI